MMTQEQKQILRNMKWIPEEKQDTCETCGATMVGGEPVYDAKTSQRYKCTMFHIDSLVDKFRNDRRTK